MVFITSHTEIFSGLIKLARGSLVALTMLAFSSLTVFSEAGAQDSPDVMPPAAQPSATVEAAPPAPSLSTNPSLLRARWAMIEDAMKENDLKAINDDIYELDKLRIEGGFDNLEEYSLILLEKARMFLSKDDLETATFYTRKALHISPESPRVRVRSLPLLDRTGLMPASQQVLLALSEVPAHPDLMIGSFRTVIYPLLWAFTLGLYVVMLLHIIYNSRELMRGLARFLPPTSRGIAVPSLLFGALALPIIAGPLWTILAWTILVQILAPNGRWLGLGCGLLIAGWGMLIPLRENSAAWSRTDGSRHLSQVLNGSFDVSDREKIEALLLKRPSDGALHYAHGVVLRRYGEFDQSEMALLRAENLLGKTPEITAQRAVIAFLRGQMEAADRLMTAAREEGYRSAEFFFNFSKIKFELTDTAASREMAMEANRLDPSVTVDLRKREDILGLKSSAAVAEIKLPSRFLRDSAFERSDESTAAQTELMAHLMRGMSPILMILAGVGVAVFFAFASQNKRRARLAAFYSDYRVSPYFIALIKMIPGGAWVLVDKHGRSIFILSILIFLLLPLLGWPSDGRSMRSLLEGIVPVYICVICIVGLVAGYFGLYVDEEA